MTRRRSIFRSRIVAAAGLLVAGLVAIPGTAAATPVHAAPAGHEQTRPGRHGHDPSLSPRTHFTMKPDGSSGRYGGGEGIPNIDVVKSTIRTYYGDTGDGIADKNSSPYISELNRLAGQEKRRLAVEYRRAARHGEKPALVFDADDTTLWTYDMEAAAMNFVFDPELQDEWVQGQRFAATPGMVDLVNSAAAMGYRIFGLTGRNDDQLDATVANLRKVGYRGFSKDRFYTKWTGKGDSQQPDYITCAQSECSTVEYKALTRRHIEHAGYRIVANFGDQWSDLQGGYADRTVKLPNPTYYLPSPNLPGRHQPWLSSRTHFTMKPDGSSGRRVGGEGIPNIDSVKETIATYYGDTGDGTADRDSSPYIRDVSRVIRQRGDAVINNCRRTARHGGNPAIVLDADDTTLWTYDMEAAAMNFVFDPELQDQWVQAQKFPATPAMVDFVNAADRAGCAIVGLTGRNDGQKSATVGNLTKVGYHGFSEDRFYTKWTGKGDSQQPDYIHCAAQDCTTVEYKSQTRRHLQTRAGGHYDIVANFGDQYSDLIGGHADRSIKLPNPTYYLP